MLPSKESVEYFARIWFNPAELQRLLRELQSSLYHRFNIPCLRMSDPDAAQYSIYSNRILNIWGAVKWKWRGYEVHTYPFTVGGGHF